MAHSIDELWEDKLQPWLVERNAEQKAAYQRLWIALPIGYIAGIVAGILAMHYQGPVQLIVAAFLIPPVIAGVIGAQGLLELSKKVKRELMGQIAGVAGLSYSLKPAMPSRFSRFKEHGLLPSDDRRSFEDHFQGDVHGADFELYEAHLEKRVRTKNGTHWVTIFRGVLIRIGFPRKVEGTTVITRDKGLFNGLEAFSRSFKDKKLERIGLVDPKFEKIFEVYGNDQVIARYMLTPSFMERLLALETAFKGKGVRAVFDENSGQGELLIAAETGNQFEVSSLFKPVPERDDVMKVVGEIKQVSSIIELLVEPSQFGDHAAG